MAVIVSKGIVVPKVSMKAGNYPVGDVVFLTLNNAATEFIVVNQGKPSSMYDDSCDGTWLLMKNSYASVMFDSTDNDYKKSNLHSYITTTIVPLFGTAEQAAIRQVKIPYVNGKGGSAIASGANGLSVKAFAISMYEAGFTTSNSPSIPVDGACLSYFSGLAATDAKRIAYLNGSADRQWSRSPLTNDTGTPWHIGADGGFSGAWGCVGGAGARPIVILPFATKFNPDTNVLEGV